MRLRWLAVDLRLGVRVEGQLSIWRSVGAPGAARRPDRAPLAMARLMESPGGQLLYQFRRPWRDGSTALRLDPLESLAARGGSAGRWTAPHAGRRPLTALGLAAAPTPDHTVGTA